jgi:hypothetical protein
MEGVVSTELTNMIALYCTWQSHRTMAESSLHEAAESWYPEKESWPNYEDWPLQNELDFNPDIVNNFVIEEQITRLAHRQQVDILEARAAHTGAASLMYIQGMKEKAALAHGAPSESSPEVTQATLQPTQVEEHKEENAETATN